jgi:hypothetical protein
MRKNIKEAKKGSVTTTTRSKGRLNWKELVFIQANKCWRNNLDGIPALNRRNIIARFE